MAAKGASDKVYTITAVKRWSCDSKRIPGVEQVKEIHIFDFDNTLFATPLPNELIWKPTTVGHLRDQSWFANGGWWHDPAILAATGDGVDIEEKRGYAGWWNEHVVSEARKSIENPDILTVLLTGRGEAKFSDLVLRIVKSKGLDFDLICLKPKVTPTNVQVTSTMSYKSELLKTLIYTYKRAPYIQIWEDRPGHAKQFQNLLNSINFEIQRGNAPVQRPGLLEREVHLIKSLFTTLKEQTEVCLIQRMINQNNRAIAQGTAPPNARPLVLRRVVSYTAYVVVSDDSRAMLDSLGLSQASQGLIQWPPTVLIELGPASGPTRSFIGEVGTTIKLRVKAKTTWNNKLWAVRVEAVGSYGFMPATDPPIMLLASRSNHGLLDSTRIKKHQWSEYPLQSPFEIEATVAERLLLDVVPESAPQNGAQEPPRKRQRRNSPTTSGRHKDALVGDIHQADFISLDAGPDTGGFGQPIHSRHYDDYRPPQSISANTGPSRGRGGRSGYRDAGSGRHNDRRHDDRRGRGSFRGGRGRGRGAYRSLDDVEVQAYRSNAGGAGYRDYDAPGGLNGQRDINY